MAFSSKITAELSLDSTSFNLGLQQAQRNAEQSASVFEQKFRAQEQYAAQYNEQMTAMQDKVSKSARDSFAVFEQQGAAAGAAAGEEASSTLAEHLESGMKRKLMHGILDGILMGVGFSSVEKLVDWIVEPWKKAADEAERLEKASEKAVEAQQRFFDYLNSRKPIEVQIGLAQAEYDKIAKHQADLLAIEQRQQELENMSTHGMSNADVEKAGDEMLKLQTGSPQRKIDIETDTGKMQEQAQKIAELKDRQAQKDAEVAKATEEAHDKLAKKIAADDAAEQKAIEEKLKLIGEGLRMKDEEIAKNERVLAQEHERVLSEAARHQEEDERGLAEIRRQEQEAGRRRADDAIALRNESGATVGEVLSGKRGNATDRAKLEEAERLRRQAERIRDGGSGDYRDAKGNLTDRATAADQLESRADQITAGVGDLKSDALSKAFKEALTASENALFAIQDSLTPNSPPGSDD
jgi:hypothetical protein